MLSFSFAIRPCADLLTLPACGIVLVHCFSTDFGFHDVRALAGNGCSPAELIVNPNRSVKRNTAPGKFVTFFYAALDTRTRTLA